MLSERAKRSCYAVRFGLLVLAAGMFGLGYRPMLALAPIYVVPVLWVALHVLMFGLGLLLAIDLHLVRVVCWLFDGDRTTRFPRLLK